MKGRKIKTRKEKSRNQYVRTLIVTEGESTEPGYFRKFTTRLSRVVVVGKGKSSVRLVEEVKSMRGIDDYDRVWVVFDRDENQDFNNAITLAEKEGYNVAWSNESFELWLYLHFQYLSTRVSRGQYITMFEREVRKCMPEYKYTKSDAKNTIGVYDLLQKFGDEKFAIKNAERLCALYEDNNYDSHNPCTTVHLLVDELRHPETILSK